MLAPEVAVKQVLAPEADFQQVLAPEAVFVRCASPRGGLSFWNICFCFEHLLFFLDF